MRCPRCSAENRDGRRFCAECGASLALACPACGFSNEPDERFCGGCGVIAAALRQRSHGPSSRAPESYTPKHLAEKILTSKAALEGERKQVTVLFADLKGSMELLADRDPEEARKLLDPVLERMMEAVHRYEGTVNQVMGDGIMALFGAPLAHEDHAVRACYAALRMQESVDAVRRGGVRARTGCRSRSASGSTPARWWCAPSAAICTWTTRRSARRRTWPRAWSRLADARHDPRSPATRCSWPKATSQVKPLGPVPVKGLDGAGRGLRADRRRAAAARGCRRPPRAG